MEKRIDGFGSLSFVGSPKVFAVSAKTWRVLVLVLCCVPLFDMSEPSFLFLELQVLLPAAL